MDKGGDAWGTYRRDKEAWIAGQSGTSILRINVVCTTALLSYALWIYAKNASTCSQMPYVRDFLILIMPLMLVCTVLAEHVYKFVGVMLLAVIIIVVSRHNHSLAPTQPQLQSTSESKDAHVTFGSAAWPPMTPQKPKTPLKHTNLGLNDSPTNGSAAADGDTSILSDETQEDEVSALLGEAFLLGYDESPASCAGDFENALARSSLPSERGSPIKRSSLKRESHIRPASLPKATSDLLVQNKRDAAPRKAGPRKEWGCVTVYRAYLMVLTVLCILAVDFPVFPRTFAKCETWGTSLMDLGVGSFTFSHGVVSLRTERSSFARAMRRATPLLVLGCVRVLLVKRTEYPEHVSEYGVHWNFFFTMGILLPALEVLQQRWPKMVWGSVALATSLAYEFVLRWTRLGAWAVSDTRIPSSWISLNKEGLVSLPGYVIIALLGLDVGRILFASRKLDDVPILLLVRTMVLWVCMFIVRLAGWQTSRRLANLPYVLWCSAFNALFLFGFMQLGRIKSNSSNTPRLFELINRHSFVLFLLANIATGLINLLFQTMYTTTTMSMMYLSLYMLTICGLTPWALNRYAPWLETRMVRLSSAASA